MEFLVAAYTDKGIQKPDNQDSLCVRRVQMHDGGEMIFAMLCDGMGGLNRGELASAEVIRAFADWFDRNLPVLPALCRDGFQEIRRQWTELVTQLHWRLLHYAEENRTAMGTTMAGMLTFGKRYLLISVGDSRVYECQRQLRQLTEDQSLVAREVAKGRITPEQARHHPQRNVLLQCLGTGQSVTPAFVEGEVMSGALYLLCSDGLVHELAPEEMEDALLPVKNGEKQRLTETLMGMTELCKQREEMDNITAILIRSAESAVRPKKKKGLLFGRKKKDEADGPVLVETAQITHTEERIAAV